MSNERPTHLAEDGSLHMVDVSQKPNTQRSAVACAKIVATKDTLDALMTGQLKKGEALVCAKIAGITAAKKTGELIPLCHPINLSHVEIDFTREADDTLLITAAAHCVGPTGVEMEAMSAASVAALTIYDMAKSIERGMRIESVMLLKKSGGKSGLWTRESVDQAV